MNLKPTSRELARGSFQKRTDCFAKGDIDIVLSTFAMHSDGKIPDVQVEKIEKWLRVRSKVDERALRALPGKSARSSTIGRSRAGDTAAYSSRTSEGEDSLWESAVRLRSSASK